jgi:hypothetical protein
LTAAAALTAAALVVRCTRLAGAVFLADEAVFFALAFWPGSLSWRWPSSSVVIEPVGQSWCAPRCSPGIAHTKTRRRRRRCVQLRWATSSVISRCGTVAIPRGTARGGFGLCALLGTPSVTSRTSPRMNAAKPPFVVTVDREKNCVAADLRPRTQGGRGCCNESHCWRSQRRGGSWR